MKIEDLSDNDEIEVTSRTYLLRILIAFVALIIFLRQAFLSWDENKLLILLVIFPLLFLTFYLRCIDINIVNNSEIRLFRFEKIIPFTRIKKIAVLPIFSKGFGTTYTVCYLIYLNRNNKTKDSFFYVAQNKVYLLELLKTLVSKTPTT
jgi:hypothetical protein